MYGKIFDSMYDGTLYGHWQAIVTFQQMIVLADADGIVDMTPQAMAARTSIPFDIIKEGLPVLEAPDPYSRTPGHDGRRIELIDAHRPWGWHIINHEKYKRLRDADEVRAQNRERQQRFRDSKSVTQRNAPSRDVTPRNAQSRHTDTDTDTDTSKSIVGQKPDYAKNARLVLTYLNEKAGREYQEVPANISLITARLKEGASVEACKAVIDRKCVEWKDGDMDKFLRPATLFNATKFAQYQGEKSSPSIRVDM